MVRLRVRCRCITVAIVLLHIIMGIWFFSQPLDSPRQYILRRGEDGRTGQNILHLRDQPTSEYFSMSEGELCVREGTDADAIPGGKCKCLPGWKGKRCGVPAVLQQLKWMNKPDLTKNLQLRKRAKRIILVAPFMFEFDIFEANVIGLGELVDVFVVGEINHTSTFNSSVADALSNQIESFGSPRLSFHNQTRGTPPLLSRLKSGWLKEYQQKIIYVPVVHQDLKDGGSFLETLVYFGLRLVSDLRPDDLLLLTTGEEILRRDITVFLKLFHGYPMPIRCHYKEHLYGFYWQVAKERGNSKEAQKSYKSETLLPTDSIHNQSSALPEICAVSIHFFANAFDYKVSQLREGRISEDSLSFLSTAEEPYLDWTISEAGWRCHLCLSVQNIFRKFQNIPMALRPKWFSESPSSMLPFIQRLVKFGQDENLEKIGVAMLPSQDSLSSYIWLQRERLAHLIKNPYETMSIHNLV